MSFELAFKLAKYLQSFDTSTCSFDLLLFSCYTKTFPNPQFILITIIIILSLFSGSYFKKKRNVSQRLNFCSRNRSCRDLKVFLFSVLSFPHKPWARPRLNIILCVVLGILSDPTHDFVGFVFCQSRLFSEHCFCWVSKLLSPVAAVCSDFIITGVFFSNF